MHKQRLYLDDYVYEYITAFGQFGTVVNACVTMAMQQPELWCQQEVNEPRHKHCKQVYVVIDNPEYEEYREQCGKHSVNCSIRRLLYYVTFNELLSGINPSALVKQQAHNHYLSRLVKLTTLYSELVELANKWKYAHQGELLEACALLQEVIDDINVKRASIMQ